MDYGEGEVKCGDYAIVEGDRHTVHSDMTLHHVDCEGLFGVEWNGKWLHGTLRRNTPR